MVDTDLDALEPGRTSVDHGVTARLKRSDAWRSVFRHPPLDTPRGRALQSFSNVFLHLYPVKIPKRVLRMRYSFRLGFISAVLFGILMVSGVYLMFVYTPSVGSAYGDMQHLKTGVGFGQLIRNVHRWAAHLMVLVVGLHMIRVFYAGAYKKPREFNWAIGVMLLLLTLAFSFTGYLLPWDQLSYWAVTVRDLLYESREDFDPVTARSAELLQNQLDRFEALLGDLLEISRFDAGAAVLDPEPLDMRALVERVVDAASPLTERKGSDVRLSLPDTACLVEADARRVDRVLRNLVVNAVEHGEGRPVDITVAVCEDAVAVTVRDHGVGLRPGETSLVFNRFWRADPARARTTGGTGLGLSIALEDVRLHGGWLQAWGAPGDGANFRLTLPRSAHGAIAESPLPLEPTDAGPRVKASLATPYRSPRREEVAP